MAVDPFFNDVALLLHCEGSNGSTTFTDSSLSAKTVTANGNAQISTAQSKWGSGSGYFDGAGDYLSTPDSDDFNFGSGDFCIEAWIYINGTPAEAKIIYDHRANDGASNRSLTFYYSATADSITTDYSTDGTTVVTTNLTSSPPKSTWLHVALVRNGNTGYCYLNGTSSATTINFIGVTLYNSTATVKIGGRGDGQRSWDGYLQDVRVTKGTARYTTNFIPPIAKFPDELGHDLPSSSLTWTAQLLGQSGALLRDFLPSATIAWTEQPPVITPVLPIESLAWTAQLPVSGIAHDLPISTLTWTIQDLTQQLSHLLPSRALTWTTTAPQFTYDATVASQSSAIYRAYLYADGYDRLELPLASFQSTRRNGEATYLSIIVPAPVAYLDGIEDRLDGEIVLYSGFVIGGVETLTELIRANLSSFRYDLGAKSGSATLTGYKQVTYTNPKTRALQGISFRSAIDDVRRVRCEPDMWLNPGDTADLGGGETLVVGRIAYTINPRSATMEVTEVET